MIWLVVGQALNYLGIVNNKLFVYGGWRRDSTLAPTGNSGSYSAKVETLFVNQNFTYNGHPARGIYTAIHYQAGSSIFEDTVYEVGDTLRRLYIIGNNTSGGPYKVDIKAVVTPFSINNYWILGLSGPYVGDFDGDNSTQYYDTLWWFADTAKVLSQENVSVPAGTFSAYKMFVRLKGKIWSSLIKTQAGNLGFDPYSDSLIRDYYIWWVPNLGYVKDSLFSYVHWDGPFNVKIISKSWEVSVLQSYTTSIVERNSIISNELINFKDNVILYDVSGKVLFKGKGLVKLNKGVYFVRNNQKLIKIIVR